MVNIWGTVYVAVVVMLDMENVGMIFQYFQSPHRFNTLILSSFVLFVLRTCK